MSQIPHTKELLDLSHTLAGDALAATVYPYEILPRIKELILAIAATLPADEYDCLGNDVYVAKDASIAPTAYIGGPAIIGHKTEVRHCAYIRGSALIGDGAVVGNSTEIKNAILFDGVQVPHYNYVGDSVLGYKSHMGAGSIASNVRGDHGQITLHCGEEHRETGLRKFGTILGDFAEIGCNTVLCPGSIVGAHTQVYPLSRVRGVLPADSIYKGAGDPIRKEETK